MHPPPTSWPSSSPRRGRSASASSPATDYLNPNPDQWVGKLSPFLPIFVVHLRIVRNQEYKTELLDESTCTSRPAAPEMVPRPAAVGEASSPDERVFSDLASSCLAYGTVVALRSSACGLGHSSVGYPYIRVISSNQSGLWTARPCFVDAAFCYLLNGLQQSSRIFFFVPICPEIS